MQKNNQNWVIAYASVQGKSHIDHNVPNQDAIQVIQHPGNPCLAVAISDGAGTAPKSEEGSRHFANFIAEQLYNLACAVHEQRVLGNSHNTMNDHIINMITEARRKLDPSLLKLRDYHCNLMAIAMSPRWGIRVHLGDAILLKSEFKIDDLSKSVDYFVNTKITDQERTEYANETHFITEHDWVKHLEWNFLDPLGNESMYALMTDGAGEIALSNVPGSSQKMVYRNFFSPLIYNVISSPPEHRNRQIEQALRNKATYPITGDDKTLALVIRANASNFATPDLSLASDSTKTTQDRPNPSASAKQGRGVEMQRAPIKNENLLPPIPPKSPPGDKSTERYWLHNNSIIYGSLALAGISVLGTAAYALYGKFSSNPGSPAPAASAPAPAAPASAASAPAPAAPASAASAPAPAAPASAASAPASKKKNESVKSDSKSRTQHQ